MKEIKNPMSPEDVKRVQKIVQRFDELYKETVNPVGLTDHDYLSYQSSLAACHLWIRPLDFKAMLEGRDFDLMHDVSGIHGSINDEGTELRDHFLPRYVIPLDQERTCRQEIAARLWTHWRTYRKVPRSYNKTLGIGRLPKDRDKGFTGFSINGHRYEDGKLYKKYH